MSKILVSSSNNSDDREIDEYHDSNPSGSSIDSSNNSSSGGNTTDEQYTSGVPGVPLDVFQEEMRTRMAFGSLAGTSTSVSLCVFGSTEAVAFHVYISAFFFFFFFVTLKRYCSSLL